MRTGLSSHSMRQVGAQALTKVPSPSPSTLRGRSRETPVTQAMCFMATCAPPDGTFTVFDAPGAGTGPNQGTIADNINPAGVIAGDYIDSSSVYHGFVPPADGTAITTLDAPGAGTGR